MASPEGPVSDLSRRHASGTATLSMAAENVPFPPHSSEQVSNNDGVRLPSEFWHTTGLASRKRGRKAKAEDPRVKELERENARLQRRLARVETMLEIQKKTSELLGIPLNPLDSYEND